MTVMHASLRHSDLETLVGEVWSTCLADVEGPVPAAPSDWSGGAATDCWSSAVSVTGGWHGMVVVDVHQDAAAALARAMLGLDGEPEAADLTDAIGELSNIVGGNVKSLMPGPSSLSLPVVARSVLSPPSDLVPDICLDLAWRGAPLRVRVLTQAALPTASHPLQEATP